jgi:UDP-glucose 4-epimerase
LKKILVTGGAGFIGYHLSLELAKKNHVTIIDNFSRGKLDAKLLKLVKNKNIKFIKKNINKEIIINKKFDYIFHLAATVGVKNVKKSPSFTFQNNIIPTFNLINYLQKKNKNCIFVFFSTSEVYSPLIKIKKKVFPLKENYDLILPNITNSRDSYFISKIFVEHFLKLSGIKYIIYRPHNIYGPRMGMSHVIPELIKKIILDKNKSVKIYSPHHKRVFCYIDDCINQIIFSCFKKKYFNKVLNIGSNQKEIKIYDLAKLINVLSFNKKKLIKSIVTPGSPYRRIPDVKKITKKIKNYNETKLLDGIKKTIEWYKK